MLRPKRALPASDSEHSAEEGAQPRQLGFGRSGASFCGIGSLALRFGFRGNHATVGLEETYPVGFSRPVDAVPGAEVEAEHLAADPSPVVRRNRLVGVADEVKSFHDPGLEVVEEVVARAEDAGIEVLLVPAVDLLGRSGQQLDDEIGQTAALLPGHPALAIAFVVSLDPVDEEDVRTAEAGPALRHVPGLGDGVIDELVPAGKEIGPAALLHGLVEQVQQEMDPDDVHAVFLGLPVFEDEFEGKIERLEGWLAHGILPSESFLAGTLSHVI